MSVPTLKQGGGIYELIWHQESIVARLDKVVEDSKYNTFAEVLIRSSIPGVPQHLHQARVNLTSTTARSALVRQLATIAPDVHWNGLVEQMAVKVLEAHREGEPLIQFAEYAPSERVGYRVSPLLQEKQNTVVYGEGESGKSYLSIYLAVLVATGIPRTGFVPEPGGVLYLDYETDRDTMWDRVNLITAGLGVAIPDNLFYRYMHQPLAADIETIQKMVFERNIDLVIVDSAAPACSEPESASFVAEYFRALRSLQATTLTIAHITKNTRDAAPFGSVFWRNLPRANFKVQAAREPGDDHFVMGLKHTKSNNGKRLRDIGVAVEFKDESVIFTPANLADVDGLANTLPLRDRIKSSLKHGAMTVRELADELELAENTLRTTLNRNKDSWFVSITYPNSVQKWGNLEGQS